MKDIDFDREKNNSSAAELEHKWQKKYHNLCVLMNIDYGLMFLYNYGLFKIEYREKQLAAANKNNCKIKWKDIGTW